MKLRRYLSGLLFIYGLVLIHTWVENVNDWHVYLGTACVTMFIITVWKEIDALKK